MPYLRGILDKYCLSQFLKLALEALREKNYLQAIESLEMIRQHDAAAGRRCSDVVVFYLTEARLAQAQLLQKNGDFQGAVDMYRQAMKLAPKYADIHLALGKLFAGRRQTKQALRHLRRAVALNPNYIEAHLNIAHLKTESGDPAGAISVFRSLANRTSLLRQDLFDRAEAEADRGRTRQALRLFSDAFISAPERGEALCAMGRDALRAGREDEAMVLLRRALRLRPKYADIHNLMGVCQSQRGDEAAAARHFLKAVSLAPNFARAWLNLAYTQEQRGDSRGALAAYRRVLKLDPRNAIAAAAAKRLTTRERRA